MYGAGFGIDLTAVGLYSFALQRRDEKENQSDSIFLHFRFFDLIIRYIDTLQCTCNGIVNIISRVETYRSIIGMT